MLIVLAILLGLGLAVLLVPVLIALRVEHAGPAEPLDLQLSWGFLLGGAGVQLRLRGASWYLHPLLAGQRLPFPRLRLGEEPEGEEAPPATGPAPPSERAAEQTLQPAPASPSRVESGPTPEPGPSRGAAPPPRAGKPDRGLAGLARGLVRPALRLLRRLARTLRLRRLRLQGSFGLADPAATGQVFGYLQGARGLLPGRLRLELSPDFVRQGVRGTAHLAIHFYLGKALYLLACFAARLAWRWWGIRRAARRSGPPVTTPSTRR